MLEGSGGDGQGEENGAGAGQRVGTGAGHGNVTCVLQTQFSSFIFVTHDLVFSKIKSFNSCVRSCCL